MKTTSFQVTAREKALIVIMRRLRHGTIEKLGVADGQPSIVLSMSQRIDLSKEADLDAAVAMPVEFPFDADQPEPEGEATEEE